MRFRSLPALVVTSLLLLTSPLRAATFAELNNAIFGLTVQLGTLGVFYQSVQVRAINQRLKIEAMIPKIDARPVAPAVKAALLAKALAIVTKLEAVQSIRDDIANEQTNVTCYYEAAKECRDRGDFADGMVAVDEANRSCATAFGMYAEVGRQQDTIDTDLTALQQLVDA